MQPARAAAATSNTINFQARLETNAGAIVPDGNYNVEFKLYNVATLGSAEWTEDYTYNSGPGSTDVRLRVANGYLTANLGSITAFPGTINWNQQQWLTMNIGGTVSSGTITWDGEMSPRLQLTAVPYAFAAGTLSATDGSGNTGTLSFGTVTNNPVITLPNASGTVCLQSSSACGFATGSGTAFLQGGNSFGAQGVLGTNDSNSLAIRTNNTNKLVIDTSGNLQLQQASTFNIASASGGSQLAIQAGANSTAAGTGGTLLLQGGAPGTTGVSGSVIVKANTNDSTSAFQVQNAGGSSLFTVDSTNTALVLGNNGTPTALTVRGGAATGSNAQGANITFDASNGTGNASSGDIIFRTAASGANQATLDVTSSNTTGGASSLTWTHITGSHSNQILIVGVGTTGVANDVTGITYNGVALTKVNSETCPAGHNCDEELWYLVSPASGSHSIVVSLGDNQAIFGGAATYYNVNTTTPFGTSAVAQGGSNPSSVTVTTNNTQLVVDGIMEWSNGGLGNPSAGQTKLWEPSLSGFNSGGSSKVGGSSSTTMGWAINYGNWADVAVPINPAASITPATLTDRLHITAAGNVGVDNANPQYALDVVGTGNFSASVLSPVLDTATAAALNIGNTNASAINIGNTTSNIQTAINGTALIKPTTGHDSTTAFQVQNASGAGVLSVDTSGSAVTVGGTLVVNAGSGFSGSLLNLEVNGSSKFAVNQAGIITTDSMPYKARAYSSVAGQTIASGTGSFTQITLGSTSYDPNSNFNTSTSTYTVPVSGYYLVKGEIAYSSNASLERLIAIEQNGSIVSEATTQPNTTSGAWTSLQVSDILYFSANDAITLAGRQDSGSTLAIETGSTWTNLAISFLSY